MAAVLAVLFGGCGAGDDGVFEARTGVVVGAPGPGPVLRIHRHSGATGAELAAVDSKALAAGWSFVRAFHTAAGSFLFLLKRSDGDAQVWRLNEGGGLADQVGSYSLPRDITSAAFVYPDDKPVLLLHARHNGRFVTWSVANDGRITGVTSDQTRPELRYKDMVLPYLVGARRYVVAVDRWYGAAAIFPLTASGTLSATAQPILDSQTWTQGWTSAAFYHVNDDAYLILYKVESGEIGVKRFNSDGSLPSAWHQEHDWNTGWTDLVVRDSKLFMYRADTGRLVVRELGAGGIGAQLSEGNIGAGWTSLTAFQSGGSQFLAKLNEEGLTPFDHRMAQRFKDVVVDRFGGGKTVGFQVGVMQSGRIVMLHGEGWAHRSAGTPMTTKTKQGAASVSKMITTVSMLKLIENGEVDWNDRVIDHLPAPSTAPHEDYFYLSASVPLHASLTDVRISELLTHTAKFSKDGTGNVLSKPRKVGDCDSTYLDPSWSPDPRFRCDREYTNSSFGIAGFTIAAKAGLPLTDGDEDPEAFDAYLEDLWMRDANTAGMICARHDATAYYAACDPGPGCDDGFVESVHDDEPRYCSSGSWVMSTEDALQFLSAVRYGKVLNPASTDLLFSKQQRRGGGDMAVGWDGIAEIDGGLRYGKDGGGEGVRAYIAHFPRGVDAVMFTNTSPCNGCGDPTATLNAAYQAAIAE